MLIKIITTLLIIVVVYMGFKQGRAMLSGKPEMLTMFAKWNFSKTGIGAFGAITMLSAFLILLPQTFTAGNFLMSATILLIICLQLSIRELKGAAIEIPFLLLNMVLIYLQDPVSNQK
jgi:hypothetical protein